MKPIIVKYSGTCQKCGQELGAGENAIYEKRIGLFCPGCEPTDPDEIRAYRQEAADMRADRYEEWASKRRKKANEQLTSYSEIRHDIAFVTQPGRIPFRDKMNRADDRACESLRVAEHMEQKAESLRHVRVKGDRERQRELKRQSVREWLQVGMRVDTGLLGEGIVTRINKKTATIDGKMTVELSWLRAVKQK